MSALLLQTLAAFAITMVFAYVVGSWTESMRGAARVKDQVGEAKPALVTVLVPARNAMETLPELLQDLYAQQWPKDALEVLVVDDGSTDGTGQVVLGMANTWHGLKLLRATGAGKKAAIAQGVARAEGEWVVLTDADARCGPLRVRNIMQAMQGKRTDLLLMPVGTVGRGWLQRLQVEEQLALLGVGAGTGLQGGPALANGANMAFRKEAFSAVGGYEGDGWASGDDIFLLRRMRDHGRQVEYLFDPEVTVIVQAEVTLRGFWQQRLRWAGKMRATGLAILPPLAGILLPWFLVYITGSLSPSQLMAQRPFTVLVLLASAWMLWLLPILALVNEARRFLEKTSGDDLPRGNALATLVALAAFSVYAPVVALASLVFRPVWKGRRI